MIAKKICMVGASGVGKTSLVSTFVHRIFSEKYLTTIGVKVDKKVVDLPENQVTLMIWDLAGVDEFHTQIPPNFLRGTGGCLLVVDGTRVDTVDRALEIERDVRQTVGAIPFVILLNKADLVSQWTISDERLARVGWRGPQVFRTSAKTGEGVEAAFTQIAHLMVS